MTQDTHDYPLETYLGLTAFRGVQVSPDGRRVVFITARDDFDEDRTEVALWRLDLDERGQTRDLVRLTFGEGAYMDLGWSPDGRYLAFLSTRSPAQGPPQLFVLDMRGSEPMPLTTPDTFAEGIAAYAWLPDGSGLVLAAPEPEDEGRQQALAGFYGDVKRYAPQESLTGIWRIDVAAFSASTPTCLATVQQRILELSVSPDGRQIAYISGPSSKPAEYWDRLSTVEIFLLSLDGAEPAQQLTNNAVREANLRWSRNGKTLYVSGFGEVDRGRDRVTQGRLYRIDLEDGVVLQMAPGYNDEFSPLFGLAPFAQMPDGTLLANGLVGTRTNVAAVDPISGHVTFLSDYRGETASLSASRDASVIAFVLTTHQAFPDLYLAAGIDDLSGARPVTDFNAILNGLSLPAMETLNWENGEGDTIEGVVHWPPGRQRESGLPLVVVIHGGPQAAVTETVRSSGTNYPTLLAGRGYLVLEPNYRGGTGRGDAFFDSIQGQPLSRPATDILTGVDALIDQGWADPDRLGVMGYSYGGTLTNYLITRTHRFQAACSGASIWNIISYFGTADNFLFLNDSLYEFKPPWEDIQTYWQESAISRAGAIRTPTLISVGQVDRRCPFSQSHELYRALVRLGVSVEMLVFPDEGHAIQKPSHKRTKVRAELAWLDHYLLGKPLPQFDDRWN